MKNIFLLTHFLILACIVQAQVLPALPTKPNSVPEKKQDSKTQNIVSNDRDGDGLTNTVDRCPDQNGPVSNYGCPIEKKKNYNKVTIGGQVWMQENLNVVRFRNGDPIPEASGEEEWERYGIEGKPAWCFYDNDPANGRIYGKLYNWYAVTDPRGLAPSGWHIPTDMEWSRLIDYLGGEKVAWGKLKSLNHWKDINEGGATVSSGFSGLPGGYRNANGSFNFIGNYGYWWSSTEIDKYNAWIRYLFDNYANVYRGYYSKELGCSVRCVRD